MALKVGLRPWRAADAADIAVMTRDPHIRRWSSMGEDVPGWIEHQRAGTRGPSLAVCVDGEDRAVGKMALRLPGHASPATACEAIAPADAPVGELSYWLVPEVRGRGLARPAVAAMMAEVVPGMGLRSVVLDIEVGNAASMRVAEGLGAERRSPARVELDRLGRPRTLVVFVLRVGGVGR